jgi:hypothetical protein
MRVKKNYVKKFLDMENIFTSSNPMLIHSMLLGLFPMSFDGPARKGSFKTKWHDVILVVAFGIFQVFIIRTNLTLDLWAPNVIIQFAWAVTRNFEGFSYVLLFWYQIWNRKNIVKFLRIIDTVDQKV